MNKKLAVILVAAAAGLASTASFAENLDNPAFPAVQGTPVSRAQVQAELAQYERAVASAPATAEDAAPVAAETGAPVSRAQVAAELQQYQLQAASGPATAEDPAPL
ncbi:MAG: hypothetical protein GAK30_03225 [Paracidovorax wautersii]|uniref:DUF4148 domain-containing protein n=1 Tax=Paracidovorax wautersii TaxID=1177982 RepID=A0A7V8FLG5_9BURK|nr:MAG: hypothetical protein GAK30_03225 [Paracidovorax wautersii]